MTKIIRNTVVGIAMSLVSTSLIAQTETAPDTVVATVNGAEITVGHLMLARGKLPAQYQQYPDDILFPGLLDQLIRLEVLKSTLSGNVPARVTYGVENEERALMASVAISRVMQDAISEDLVEQAYKDRYAGQDLGLEYNASHILVETEEEAQTILAKLQAGDDFATAAQEYSTGPSGPGGGSLGWFRRGDMVGPFDAAVAEMQVGSLAGPVQTQFGWHVIKLNETRQIEAPALEEVRGEIEDELGQTAIEAKIAELLETADVQRMPTDGIDPSILSNLSLLEK